MVHYFITCYHNICGYEKRKKLTKEFLERYPQVTLIEEVYEENNFKSIFNHKDTFKTRTEEIGFINNIQINKFIEEVWEDLESLTFIDSDVILYEDFFDKVVEKLDIYDETSLFIQPFSTLEIIYDNKNKVSKHYEGAIYKKSTNFHTGLIYTYNRHFLETIDKKFPEFLLLGSYDTFLYNCLFEDEEALDNYLNNFNEAEQIELVSFYLKLQGTITEHINEHIKTFAHGNYVNRKYNDRMELYKSLTNEVILEYFKGRKEDEIY